MLLCFSTEGELTSIPRRPSPSLPGPYLLSPGFVSSPFTKFTVFATTFLLLSTQSAMGSKVGSGVDQLAMHPSTMHAS